MKKYIKFALLSFLILTVLITLIYGLLVLAGVNIENVNFLWFYIGSIVTTYVPIMIMFLAGRISFCLGKTVVEIEAGNIDIIKEQKYFRDILKKHSALELAYLEKMEDLNESDVIAVLLELEHKKVIKLKNNAIVSIDRSISITRSQEYLLGKMITGKIELFDTKDLTKIVKQEACENGLIQKEKNIIRDIVKMFIKTNLFVIIFVVCFITFTQISVNFETPVIFVSSLIMVFLGILTMYRWVYFASYVIHKIKSYKITEQGKDIKLKLLGLKKFIKEFSNLNDNDKKTLKLWDEYLIYSVMFDENNIIKKEMKDILKIEELKDYKMGLIFILVFFLALFYLILL